MYGVAQVMRRPSSLILKQSYRPNPSFCAEVKPMSGAKGNTNHVTTPDLDAKNGLITWVNVKHATPLQDETHLVFRMCVFLVELIEHGVKIWCVRVNIYDVCCNKSSLLLENINFRFVGSKNVFSGSGWIHAVFQRPDVVFNTVISEEVFDLSCLFNLPRLSGNRDYGHLMFSCVSLDLCVKIVWLSAPCEQFLLGCYLKQKLENLNVPSSLSQGSTPGVEAVP